MKSHSFTRTAAALSLVTSLWLFGCESSNSGGGASPTPSNTTRPSATASARPTATAPAATATRPPTSTRPPTPTVTPTRPATCGTNSGTGCAPLEKRVDLYRPTFSNPTRVTNPFYPVSDTLSNVFLGVKEGKQFRSEGTLIPKTRVIESVETLEFQYMAFFDGRIEEVAYDWFAQDDRGAVWYFGESVADYNDNGEVFTTAGTWLAGVDGGVAMIMPAAPKVGDAFRSEDAAPAAFEELTITALGQTREGPSGLITNAMETDELTIEGNHVLKVFAPGYGEFATGTPQTEYEPIALAISKDRLTAPVPAELVTLTTKSAEIFAAAAGSDWTRASAAVTALTMAGEAFNAGTVPPLLKAELGARLTTVRDAVAAMDPQEARQEAIAVARVTFDLRLRHQPPSEIDRARFDLWLSQVVLDAVVNDAGGIRGDVSTLEMIWRRIVHTFDAAAKTEIEGRLADLRRAADASNSAQASTVAGQLRDRFALGGWN